MKYREDNNVKRNDFLQMMLELKKKGKIEDSEVYSHGEAIAAEQNCKHLFVVAGVIPVHEIRVCY